MDGYKKMVYLTDKIKSYLIRALAQAQQDEKGSTSLNITGTTLQLLWHAFNRAESQKRRILSNNY